MWLLLALLGCEDTPQSAVRLQGIPTGERLTLSRSLNDVGAGLVDAVRLSPDLQMGGFRHSDEHFLHVADVATWSDGRFAVLDRVAATVRVFDHGGQLVDSMGRRGEGPGEFRSPYALETVGERLVVWDANPVKRFTVFDAAGEGVSTLGTVVAGDWNGIPYRHPIWPDDRFQMPLEDVTRRLAEESDSTFVHQVQPDERFPPGGEVPFPYDGAPSFLVRYSSSLEVLDTVVTLVAPPSVEIPASPGMYPKFAQPIWAGRPLWTTGEGWIAYGQGTDTTLTVRFSDGDTLQVTWPADSRRISEADQRQFIDWMRVQGEKRLSEEQRKEFMPQTRRDKEATIRRLLGELIYSTTSPAVTGLLGAGPCLFLSGFGPADNPRARANSIVVVDVRVPELLGVVRIDRPGARLREATTSALISSHEDDDGLWVLERYPLPSGWCGPSA